MFILSYVTWQGKKVVEIKVHISIKLCVYIYIYLHISLWPRIWDSSHFKLSQRCFELINNLLNLLCGGFPGCPVVKNPPSNAGDMGSIPNQGNKIPHAVGYLSPHATATEPTYTGACV